MSRLERCGQPWSHPAHEWSEGPAWDREIHVCDGGSDEMDELDRQRQQDDMFELGAY